jgi:uncharacterized lipoprotein YmbA
VRHLLRPRPRHWLGLTLACLVAACASPPLKVYTLGAPAIATGAESGDTAASVEVWRVSLPDYLDTQDIVLRQGSEIDRSSHARWASRLSAGATDLITARLAAARPDLFVTDQPLVAPARFRLYINISRLDVSADGTASLAADWTIVPRDEARPLLHDRTTFSLTGPVATDADVVALTNAVLDELAARVGKDVARLAPIRS